MRHLAKLGFSQSYTYFTWKNSRARADRVRAPSSPTPASRSTSARTSSPTRRTSCTPTSSTAGGPRSRRGSCSRRRSARATGSTRASSTSRTSPVREGSEEYLHSEKYELKQRALDGPLLPLIARLNEVRREQPGAPAALERHVPGDGQRGADRLRQAVAGQYGDHGGQHRPPRSRRRGSRSSRRSLGLPPSFTVHDLLSDERFQWRIGPQLRPARARCPPGARAHGRSL